MRIHTETDHKTDFQTILWKNNINISCRVDIGTAARFNCQTILNQLKSGAKVLLLTQKSLPQNWVNEIEKNIGQSFKLTNLILPDGEACKSIECLTQIWEILQNNQFSRQDTIIGLGGGAVLDIAGFAASTYLRGLPFISIPTTLLAQVDAGIGGKTAINLSSGKNLAGTFYFPQAIIIDPEFLATLPETEFKSGLGEIIKYALIEKSIAAEAGYRSGPRSLLKVLEETINHGKIVDADVLSGIILACVKMKLAVVAKDMHEIRLRRILNLGHTLGHALEKVSGFKIMHGEGVSIGLVFAARIALQKGLITDSDLTRCIALIHKAALTSEIPAAFTKEDLITAMAQDKKRQDNQINFILPSKELGFAEIENKISLDELADYLH